MSTAASRDVVVAFAGNLQAELETMRSIHARLVALVIAALCAGCGGVTPSHDTKDHPVAPTLKGKAITCQTAFEGFLADQEQVRQQAEFDSLVACQTREQWIDVGADVLLDDREPLNARLDELCAGGGLRHAETPVCRSSS